MHYSALQQFNLGIVGGGQLGRMTALAAHQLGIKVHVFADQPGAPALAVTPHHTLAAYDDLQALRQFARQVDCITFEFENIPVAGLQKLVEEGAVVRPGLQALAISQDRLAEKKLACQLGIAVADFVAVNNLPQLQAALVKSKHQQALPCILKTRSMGYDGKGQVRIEQPEQAAAAWDAIQHRPAIVESYVGFAQEVSMITARGVSGTIKHFPLAANLHRQHILVETRVPAQVSAAIWQQARHTAEALVQQLNLVGLLTVEFFVTRQQTLVFNEMAPRPHNSGHWTQDFCTTSQFEQLVRAVCGLPLGSVAYRPAKMVNLLGQDMQRLPELLNHPEAKVHLYGKAKNMPGCKMGHVNWGM